LIAVSKKKEDYQSGPRKPGRPPLFDKQIEVSIKKREVAKQALDTAESHQNRMKEAVQQIGKIYLPVDLKTGKLKETEAVSESLEKCFADIESVASEVNLLDRSLKRIKKAKKVIVDMIATILFFTWPFEAKWKPFPCRQMLKRL